MYKQSIGLIETIGLTSAIVAADVAVKSANVELIGYELTKGSGMVTVKISGDVGSVKAGIDSAIAAVSAMGEVYSYKVIPRLGENVEKVIYTKDTVGIPQKDTTEKKEVVKPKPKAVQAPKKPRVQKRRNTKSKANEATKSTTKNTTTKITTETNSVNEVVTPKVVNSEKEEPTKALTLTQENNT